MLEPKLYTRI